MRLIGFAAVLLSTFSVSADVGTWPPVPASESEIALITDKMGINSADEATRSSILKIEGFKSHPDADYDVLTGHVWLKPVLAQGRLCILTQVSIYGEVTESGYEWPDEPFITYWNWLADDSSECDIEDPSDVEGALVTYEPIPSDSVIQIITNADRLIEAVLSHPDADKRFLNSKYVWALSEIRLPFLIDFDLGFPFQATLVSPSAMFGPSFTFSIQNGEFIVHSVGVWMN